jgi:hypothetical protein
MKNLFTTGEIIWITSIILFGIWVYIGYKLGIDTMTISVYGSIGMLLFVILVGLAWVFVDWDRVWDWVFRKRY